MARVQDGLNSMPWLSLGALSNGWKIELAPVPPRDKRKFSYDLWSNGLAFEAFAIGRTYKASIRAPGYGDGIWLFNFDTGGRLVNASYTGHHWGPFEIPVPDFRAEFRLLPYPSYRPEIHRLVGGTWLRGKWLDRFDNTGLAYRAEIVAAKDTFYQACMHTLDEFARILVTSSAVADNPQTLDLLEALRDLPVMTHAELLADAQEFHSILEVSGQIPVEPPELAMDHYHAIPVRVQGGCGGPCTFCGLYDRRVRVLPLADVRRQMDRMAEYLGEELDHFNKVVLLEGDALETPPTVLGQELAYARRTFALDFPSFAHAFAKAQTVVRLEPKELAWLHRQGLHNVNIGLESGCQELLDLIKPGQHLQEVREAVLRLGEAGIAVSLNVIAGLGGASFQDRHVQETIDFIRSLPVGIAVFCAPLMVSPKSRYARQETVLEALPAAAIRQQCRAFETALGASRYLFVPI